MNIKALLGEKIQSLIDLVQEMTDNIKQQTELQKQINIKLDKLTDEKNIGQTEKHTE